MTHYDVPITNAKTKWYGPLDFSVTYSDDKELVVENTNLYVTGQSDLQLSNIEYYLDKCSSTILRCYLVKFVSTILS